MKILFRLCLLLVAVCTLLTPVDAYGAKKLTKEEKYVAELVELFDDYYVPRKTDCGNTVKVKNRILKALSKKPKEINDSTLSGIFYEQIRQTLQNQSNITQSIKEIDRFVCFFPNDKRVKSLLNVKAQMYIEQNNWMQLDKTIRRLEEYANATGADCEALISELSGTLVYMMSTESYNHSLQGVWVSDSLDKKTGLPLFMFRIYGQGVEFLEQSYMRKKVIVDPPSKNTMHPINSKSKCRDPYTNCFFYSSGSAIDSLDRFNVTFFTREVKTANDALANGAIDMAQTSLTKAIAHGAAGSYDAMGGYIASAGFFGLMAYAASQSSVQDLCMYVQMTQLNENVIDARIDMINDFSKSSDPIKIKNNTESYSAVLYRVNSADDVILYDKGKHPFPLYENNCYTQEVIFNDLESFTPIKKSAGAKIAIGAGFYSGVPFITLPIMMPIMNHRMGKKKARYNTEVIEMIKEAALHRQAVINEYWEQNNIYQDEE